jgi:hypothetical protein
VPSVPSVPNLIAASDSGVSATDNITNDTTPSFDVIGESGVTVELLVNGTVVSSTSTPITGSIYRLTTPALADGTYDVASRQRATASGLTGPVSSALSVTIDTIAPAAPGAPDLTAASDTGQSATDNVTRDNTPTFQLTAPSDATVQLLRGGATVIGSLQLTTGGLISITADAQVDGTFTVTARASDVAGNTSTVSGGLTMTIDTVAPTVTSVAFAFETEHALSYGFSESLGNSLQVADLTLQNLTSATTIPAGSIALSGTTFRFPVLAGGILTDGNYRTTLVAAGVTDIAGNSLPSDHLFDFFVLSGDANRDRSVDIGDFSILAARFNLPGTFSQGDFNYSGATEIGDFAILASKFNTSLPAARSPSPRAAAGERRTVADAIDRLSDELLEIRPGPYTDGDAWIY